MKHKKQVNCENIWKQYLVFKNSNDLWSAFVELSTISHYLNTMNTRHRDAEFWHPILREESKDFERCEVLEDSFKETLQYIKHVLSIGEEFIEEEIVPILTRRLSLELARNFSKDFNLGYSWENFSDADDEIKFVLKNKRNLRRYNASLRLIRRNSDFPLVGLYEF